MIDFINSLFYFQFILDSSDFFDTYLIFFVMFGFLSANNRKKL